MAAHSFRVVVSSVLLVLIRVWPTSGDVYWREYNSEVPVDALPAGKDLDGRDTYIGQAYIDKNGLYVVQIYPGKEEVTAACGGVVKISENIKILCTRDIDSFDWITTNNTHFQLDMIDKDPVKGGFVYKRGYFYVGRIFYEGILKIGEVFTEADNTVMYFPHDGSELEVKRYQVLVYRKPNDVN